MNLTSKNLKTKWLMCGIQIYNLHNGLFQFSYKGNKTWIQTNDGEITKDLICDLIIWRNNLDHTDK